MSCLGANGECDREAKRGGYCWGHRKRLQRGKPVDTPLREPKGAARDRAGLPRRSALAWLQDAVADLSEADSLGDREAYQRALDRVRMGGRARKRRGELRPRTG